MARFSVYCSSLLRNIEANCSDGLDKFINRHLQFQCRVTIVIRVAELSNDMMYNLCRVLSLYSFRLRAQLLTAPKIPP